MEQGTTSALEYPNIRKHVAAAVGAAVYLRECLAELAEFGRAPDDAFSQAVERLGFAADELDELLQLPKGRRDR